MQSERPGYTNHPNAKTSRLVAISANRNPRITLGADALHHRRGNFPTASPITGPCRMPNTRQPTPETNATSPDLSPHRGIDPEREFPTVESQLTNYQRQRTRLHQKNLRRHSAAMNIEGPAWALRIAVTG